MEQQAPQQPQAERGWVRVSNIAPAATKEELLQLFGFCGYVSGMSLAKDPNPENPNLVAVVEFWDKSAVTTACLLSSAVIQGQPIHVELYIPEPAEQQQIESNVTTASPPPPATGDPSAKQSKTAVIARLAVSGYVLASDVKNKAIAWDSGNLSIVQKLETLGAVALMQAEKINEKYHLSDKKDEFLAAAEKKALELKAALEANPDVQKGLAKVVEIDKKVGISVTANSLFESAKSYATVLKEETQAEYEKRKAAAAAQQNTQKS